MLVATPDTGPDTTFYSGYTPTYYRDTAHYKKPPRSRLADIAASMDTDICIIGGGLAGLCAGLSLAERGQRVVLIEKNRIGWGASGRNGGIVLSGYDYGMTKVERKLGPDAARSLYRLTTDALDLIKRRISSYAISCGPLPHGTAVVSCSRDTTALQSCILEHNRKFGSAWEFWDKTKTHDNFRSMAYHGAIFMPESFQIQPLDYILGLAGAFEKNGGIIIEQTETASITRTGKDGYDIHADGGIVHAHHVVCAGSGYLSGDMPFAIRAATMPVLTFIAVTEPLSEAQRAASVNCRYAAFDSRHIMNYFRLLQDNRLLWGGGASVFAEPRHLADFMKNDLCKFFPALADVKIESAWSGTMGCSRHRMPQIGRLNSGIWHTMGHCGQGLATTTMGGELIARAIVENDRSIDLFKPYGLSFTGGRWGRAGAALFCRSMAAADRISGWIDRFRREKPPIY